MILIFDIFSRPLRVLILTAFLFFLFSCPALADEVTVSDDLSVSEEQEVLEFCSITNDWIYTLTHTVTLTNDSRRLAYDITVEVPLQDNLSPAYAHKIGEQLDPYPYEIVTDESGRRTAKYYIQGIRAGSSVTLTQKYGVEKGRIAYYVMVGIVCGGSVAASQLMTESTEQEINLFGVLPIVCLIGIGIFALSWYLSIVFYKKREL